MFKYTGEKKSLGRAVLAAGALVACSDSRRRLELTPMTIIVKGESAEGRTTGKSE